jgi:hypothetical protein
MRSCILCNRKILAAVWTPLRTHPASTTAGPLQVWRSFMEHLELAIAERKLHKVFRLLTAAEDVLEDVAQRCLSCANTGAMLPLHLWLEQKAAALEQSRRSAITLLERSIMARACCTLF